MPGSVLSVQANGPTVITADTKEWSGEMVVNEDVSINGKVNLTGDTTLTIADGKMLTLDGHITTQWSNGYGLTVNGSGRLKVNYSSRYSDALFARNFTVEGASVEVSNSAAGARVINIGGASEGNFTISSGSVKVTDTDAQYGIYANGSITINGGSVEVNVRDIGITGQTIAISAGVVSAKATSSGEYAGAGYGISGEGITVTGGQVTASGARAGILMMGGSSTFGYSDADDFIDISGIEVSEGPSGPATIAIKDGQVLSDGTNFYDSTASSETIAALSNVKLVPAYAVNVASGITGGSISTNSYAAKGDNVTVTATPDEGNVLDTLTVTDAGSNSVQVSGDGNTRTFTMPEKEVTITAEFIGKAATPTFSPASGTTFTNTLNVTVSCATNGAMIYYTKDGSAPTTSSMEYTGAISVSETSTIKAIAVKDGMADSAVAEASYSKTSASGGESAVVTKAPTANTLAYTDSAQELVTAGTAENGTMQYALGENGTTAPTSGWSADIPTGTDAKTYYVWYKAKGNEGYKDSEAKCVTAKIDSAPTPTPSGGAVDGRGGAVTTEELKKEYDKAAIIPGSAADKAGIKTVSDAIDALQNGNRKVELLDKAVQYGGAAIIMDNPGETKSELVTNPGEALAAILTPGEMVEAVIGGMKVDVILEVQETQAPDSGAQSDIESKKDANEQVVYINVNLYVKRSGKEKQPVTEAKNDLKMTFTIPESIRGEGRTFRMIWSHRNADGSLETSIYNDEDNDPNTFTVSVNKLSTVGLTYTTGSVTPTYTPSYSSGSSYTGSSYSSGSGDGGGSGTSYIVASSESSKGYYDKIGKSSVEYVSPKISKKAKVAKVPAKIKIGKKTYKVTAVSPYAFTGQDGLRTVIIGKNVRRISPNAFYGCDKLKVLRVRSRSLTAKKIRNCLKGSGIDRVVVLRKAHNKFRFYKKIFTKKITGASTKLSVTKQK